MYGQCDSLSWGKRFCKRIASAAYHAVRYFGGKSFKNGQKAAQSCKVEFGKWIFG